MGDQDGLREFVVLGLTNKVGSEPCGRGASVGNDADLGRAGFAVDSDLAEDLLLGRRNPDVTWTRDLVDSRHGFGADRRERQWHGRRPF